MAELLVQSDSLTAIADAIREKAESTDPLVFPTGFIDALAAIGGGGDLPDTVSILATGEYTPTSDTTVNVAIRHNMAIMPNFVIVFSTESKIDATKYDSHMIAELVAMKPVTTSTKEAKGIMTAKTGTVGTADFLSANNTGITSTHFYISCSSGNKIKGGVTYRWLAGHVDGI